MTCINAIRGRVGEGLRINSHAMAYQRVTTLLGNKCVDPPQPSPELSDLQGVAAIASTDLSHEIGIVWTEDNTGLDYIRTIRPSSGACHGTTTRKRAMTDHHKMQEQNAANWFSLRPSKAQICPRVVAGKHCQADSGSCICRKHHHLLDHGRIWLDANGKHVLTGEPYDTDGDELAAFTDDMDALGLGVFITGQSMWNPGYTLLIRITKNTHPGEQTVIGKTYLDPGDRPDSGARPDPC